MKQIAIVIALCVGAWYFFVGGRKLDEQMVREHYRQGARAAAANDADRLCKQLSRKVVMDISATVMGKTEKGSFNRDEACDAFRKTTETMREIKSHAGAILSVDYDYHIDSIEIAPDRRSALVKGTTVMSIGDTAFQLKTSFNQRLESELGQTRLVHAEDYIVLRLGGRGTMSQSDFFRK